MLGECARGLAAALTAAAIGLPQATAGQEPRPPEPVTVAIEARLRPDGSASGTMTAAYEGTQAEQIRTLIKGLNPQARAAALADLLPPSLAGRARPDPDPRDEAGRLSVRFTLEDPRLGARTDQGLRLTLPWTPPPRQPGSSAAGEAASTGIVEDISLVLPDGFAAADLPPAFSTVTPGAGRYVLYHLVEGEAPGVLKAHRELELQGPPGPQRAEILEAVKEHDAAAITLRRAAQKPRSRS